MKEKRENTKNETDIKQEDITTDPADIKRLKISKG